MVVGGKVVEDPGVVVSNLTDGKGGDDGVTKAGWVVTRFTWGTVLFLLGEEEPKWMTECGGVRPGGGKV